MANGEIPETLPPHPNTDDSNSDEGNGFESHEALLPRKNRKREPSGGSHIVRPRHHSGENEQPLIINQVEDPELDSKMSRSVAIADEISTRRKYLAVFVLFLINLLNYMDRFTIAGVLLNIMNYFGINNAMGGLLQTVFIISYMAVAPIFGYLGDRYNRKLVMLVGMTVWSGCTLLASFITSKDHFVWFLILRGLVGIGEASYSTIAPTIIADLFVKAQRTRMLSVFFFAIPVGSGLGYIVGSGAAKASGSWHWALRVTPGLGVITMILMMIIIPNVKRGASETATDIATIKNLQGNRASYLDDLKYILKNKSFVFITIAFTFMAFVVGSLTIWGPVYVAYSQIVAGTLAPCTVEPCEYGDVSFIFGLITCLAGFLGVWIGAESAKKWKDKGRKNADALVCAIGLIVAAPFMLAGFQLVVVNLPAAWTMIFFADLSLCLTWTLVGDMTLYVTMPSRRSTANAMQILLMHLLGDAGSPYLLGVMSDALTDAMPDTYYSKYLGLQRAMYVTLFAAVLGGFSFLLASLFLEIDKKKVDDALAGLQTSSMSSTPPSTDSNESVELNIVSSSSESEDVLCTNNATAFSSNQTYLRPAEHPGFSADGDTADLLQKLPVQDSRFEEIQSYSVSPDYISILPGRSSPGPAEQYLAKVRVRSTDLRTMLPQNGERRSISDNDESDYSTSSSVLLLPDARESNI
ncbi:unnamed protein product [Clavelina lepadiformis]|uniref:Major facilitator superfamily (MFS) profile domain-containing protein n=2 Tax=Clavelina lepadiformis TaxID=159417 RepID=A0ABP0FPI0_CLALP